MTLRRLLVGGLVAATVGFFVARIRSGFLEVSADALPSVSRLLLAGGLLLLGQLLIGEALRPLVPATAPARAVRTAFHATHVAKYVPAGIAQGIGLALALERFRIRRTDAALGWVLHTATVILSGLGVGLCIGAVSRGPLVLLAPACAALGAIWSPLLDSLVDFGRSRVARLSGIGGLPAQGHLVAAWVLNGAGLVSHGLAFAVLADGMGISVATAVAAYLVSQAVATATPLPGGLGVREAILVGLTSEADPRILTAVITVRLMLMVVEAVLALVAAAAMRAIGVAQPES